MNEPTCYAKEDHFHPGTFAVFTPGGDHLEQFFETLEQAQDKVRDWNNLSKEENWGEFWLAAPPAEENFSKRRQVLGGETGTPVWRKKYAIDFRMNDLKDHLGYGYWTEIKPMTKDLLEYADKSGWNYVAWEGHGESKAWKKTKGEWKSTDDFTPITAVHAKAKDKKAKKSKKTKSPVIDWDSLI